MMPPVSRRTSASRFAARQHEAAFERGDDRRSRRRRRRRAAMPAAARRGRGRVDPAREHLLGRDAQRLVRARDLAGDGADRARVDVVGLLEHGGRAVEEVGDRRAGVGGRVGDHLEQLAVGARPSRDHLGRELLLAAREEVVQRAGRRPGGRGHVLERRAVVAPPPEGLVGRGEEAVPGVGHDLAS